ncbi:hypothetical protein [Methylobacterium fujisawaense]|uniref:hypothetical protein n=1 Tax=Methylobacterium fujisawaense TaxID=107400 RepID=UPI0036FCB007
MPHFASSFRSGLNLLFIAAVMNTALFGTKGIAESGGSASGTSPPEGRRCYSSSPVALIKQSYEFSNAGTADFPIEFPAQVYNLEEYSAKFSSNGDKTSDVSTIKRAPEGGPIVLRLTRTDNINPDDWQKSYLNGFAGFSTPDGKLANLIKIQMAVREKTAEAIVVDAVMPKNPGIFASADWTLVPVLCGGNQNIILGYASTSVHSVSVSTSWILASAGIIAFWISITLASYQLNRLRLQNLWNVKRSKLGVAFKPNRYAEYAYKAIEAANPIFISQDSLGFGSLARFQILIFTTVVGFVLLMVFIHSGFISGVSNTVLLLLGVTVIGGTLARAAGDWTGISSTTRRWLINTGTLIYQRDKPRWSDLFETQGEIDVAKVQALLFTVLISFGIFASNYTGLSSFSLPYQTVYLASLSQGTYVFGKLLPAETRKQVEDDVSALRAAASKLAASPADPQLKLNYDAAVKAAKGTLELTYMERFSSDNFVSATSDPRNVT